MSTQLIDRAAQVFAKTEISSMTPTAATSINLPLGGGCYVRVFPKKEAA